MSDLFSGTPLPGRFDKVEKTDLTGVRQVATAMDVRDKEIQRRFEDTRALQRKDINDAAQYDAAALGQLGEGYQMMVDDVTSKIASGELDPVQARAAVANLKSQYNGLKSHTDGIEEMRSLAEKAAKGDKAAIEQLESRFGIGEKLNYSYGDYVAALDAAENHIYQDGTMRIENGVMTAIDPNTKQRVPVSQLTGFGDGNHWFPLDKYKKVEDVGTLDDWAKSNATKTAIAFKDGKWDEARARSTYRDNVLTQDDIGRTHRLQLLGTLEDRGLVDHLSDQEKRDFRDGKNLASDKFREVIEKGEDEFVTRSQFDYLTADASGKGKSKSGRSASDDDDNITPGGLSVTAEAASQRVKGLSDKEKKEYADHMALEGGTMGHKLNRFNNPPTITGTYKLPAHPNTEKISIHGVGVNELGQRVAYILGEEKVETPNPLGDEYPSTFDTKQFFEEVRIGEDMEGIGSDIYREIYVNHPKMASLVDADRARVLDARVKNRKDPKPEDKPSITDAQQAQLDRYRELQAKIKENEQRDLGRRIQQQGTIGLERSASMLGSSAGARENERLQAQLDEMLADPVIGPMIREAEGIEEPEAPISSREQVTSEQDALVDQSAEDVQSLDIDTRGEIQKIQQQYRQDKGVAVFPIIDENGDVVFKDKQGNIIEDLEKIEAVGGDGLTQSDRQDIETIVLDPKTSTPQDRQRAFDRAYELAVEAGAPFPEVVAAQYAKESGFGKATAKGNNFFGIKYNARDAQFFEENGIKAGNSGDLDTKEERGGELQDEKAQFFTFKTPADAFKAYVLFIQNNPRYRDALAAEDAEGYARGLQEAGYATDSGYADSLIEDYMAAYA